MSEEIIRVPILSKDILREPILDPQVVKDILQIAYYYGKKCSEVLNVPVYNAISRTTPWYHKNWKYFSELYELGTKNNWDFKDYIDAQFHRASHWKNSNGRVYIPQLCSPAGIAYYYDWIDEYK